MAWSFEPDWRLRKFHRQWGSASAISGKTQKPVRDFVINNALHLAQSFGSKVLEFQLSLGPVEPFCGIAFTIQLLHGLPGPCRPTTSILYFKLDRPIDAVATPATLISMAVRRFLSVPVFDVSLHSGYLPTSLQKALASISQPD